MTVEYHIKSIDINNQLGLMCRSSSADDAWDKAGTAPGGGSKFRDSISEMVVTSKFGVRHKLELPGPRAYNRP